MKKKKNTNVTARAAITLLSVFCIALIAVTRISPSLTGPVYRAAGILSMPIQRGLSRFGTWLGSFTVNLTDVASLRAENESLRSQVNTLMAENSQLVLDKEELVRLRSLVSLSEEYEEYDTVGAHVISKGSGNWYSTFTIDIGTNDGIDVDCNVLGGAGLVGIVTQVGPDWATVRSIIDDDSNVSAMISTTLDTCIIAGNLRLIDSGSISLVKLTDVDNKVHVGDKVVTSNISEKFLPGILIGYISELSNDANNLTKSGQITPVVDFRHLQEVLVIKQKKQYVASPESGTKERVNDVSKNTPAEEEGQADEEEDAEE